MPVAKYVPHENKRGDMWLLGLLFFWAHFFRQEVGGGTCGGNFGGPHSIVIRSDGWANGFSEVGYLIWMRLSLCCCFNSFSKHV